jgi:hypothetical protein
MSPARVDMRFLVDEDSMQPLFQGAAISQSSTVPVARRVRTRAFLPASAGRFPPAMLFDVGRDPLGLCLGMAPSPRAAAIAGTARGSTLAYHSCRPILALPKKKKKKKTLDVYSPPASDIHFVTLVQNCTWTTATKCFTAKIAASLDFKQIVQAKDV